MDKLMEKLQAYFKPEEIEFRVGATNKEKTKGLALAYVTNRAIQDRLDEVFGIYGWKNEFKEWKGKSQICGISVWDGTQWITKWDGADDTDFESTKGGLSDSMKRAAYHWGIGRYLYRFPTAWYPIKQQGKSYVFVEKPKIPIEFLPECCKGKQDKKEGEKKYEEQNKQGKDKGKQSLDKRELIDEIAALAETMGIPFVKVSEYIKTNYRKDNAARLTGKQLQEMVEHFGKLAVLRQRARVLEYKDIDFMALLAEMFEKNNLLSLTEEEIEALSDRLKEEKDERMNQRE